MQARRDEPRLPVELRLPGYISVTSHAAKPFVESAINAEPALTNILQAFEIPRYSLAATSTFLLRDARNRFLEEFSAVLRRFRST